MAYTFKTRVNGQVYSYRDIRCDGEPKLYRIAQGMASVDWGNQVDASLFYGVHQAATGIIPGQAKPNFAMSLRKEEWDYLLATGVLPALGYSDKRLDWEMSFGESEHGGISKIKLTNFHFLGPAGSFKMGEALILNIACIVENIEEDPGTGVWCSPVYPLELL